MDRKIYFSWDIHYKCNFRCPYCWFYKDWASMGKRSVYLSPEEWFIHWKRIYDKYGEVKIEIVGGEPFVYPDFIELVKKLSSIHLVKVTTNLSGNMERFAKDIDPSRVDLDLNFHILFIDLETVIRKTLILKKAGFKGGICYLAYPPQMFKIKELSERFRKEGINFALAAFWGEYNGKKYPYAYTEEEKEMMRPFLGDINRVDYHLDAKSTKGRLCNAGHRYASIQGDGKVVRCGPLGEKSLGNIMDEDFQLLEKPMPCESDFCPCNEYVNLVEDGRPEAEQQNSFGQESMGEGEAIKIAVDKNDANEGAVAKDIAEIKGNRLLSFGNVKFPRLAAPYRVHWNWELGLSCNYKCSYCEVWPKAKEEKWLLLEPGAWKKIWDRMFEKYWCCHIRFSGGEPTIYPNFAELVSVLQDKHTVDITTNLSFDIKEFMRKVKPGGVSISASFHPEYNQIGTFLEKVLYLHSNGYPSTIAYVAYPPHLDKIGEAKALVERERVFFKIIPFSGKYQDRKYPDAYSPDEKALIEGMAGNSKNTHLNDINTRWYDWNVKRDKEKKEKKGNLCRMGQMYAKILPDGRVVRCCALDKNGLPLGLLGHITDENLKLLDAPMPCQADKCPCFKSMLVGCEEEKWVPLWEGPEHPVYKIEEVKRIAQDKPLVEQAPIIISGAETQKLNKTSELETVNIKNNNAHRELVNPYRVFYTWDIHYACNYRCEYCFFSKRWDEVSCENKYPGLDAWKKIWDGIQARYGDGHIHVSGGEPFTYPDFMDLVAHLAKNFTVEFDTNLSFDVEEFASKIKPGRVKFATAFHPSFVSMDEYLPKVLLLKKLGYDIGINYVAYPRQLARMKEYKDTFQKHHVSFTIMPFRGQFQGRPFPQGYTEEEKELIRQCDSNLTISSKMIDWYGTEKLSRNGTVCRMGQMYTKIHPNGDALRCCFINEKGKLGNLIEGTFALWEEPKVCVYPECPCWTAMVIGKEEEWQSHWVIPK